MSWMSLTSKAKKLMNDAKKIEDLAIPRIKRNSLRTAEVKETIQSIADGLYGEAYKLKKIADKL